MQITSSRVGRRYELYQALVLTLTSQTRGAALHSVGQRMPGLTFAADLGGRQRVAFLTYLADSLYYLGRLS
jgi:hypothetical protein